MPDSTSLLKSSRTEWGISHIYARNEHDLFFAQGFSAARDRLFQFEMWRRRATGTLAEIQGEKAVAHDRGARLLRFRGDLNQEMAHYHDNGVDIVTAFVDGVNAYIDLTRSDPELLPFEFQLLGITPGHWSPDVVLSRHNALTGGVSTELSLAQTISALGTDLTAKVLPFERAPYLEPKPGIDLGDFTPDIMADYTASRTLPAFDSSDVAGGNAADGVASHLNALEERRLDITSMGSNNWVIAGSRTASGKPILANDPHRSIQNPSLRYMVHLNSPGWNVIGAGEPVLPGVSIGHNEYGAWGLTIFRIDQEDLYVYETHPDQPNQYRYQGEWRDMELEQTVIGVRGSQDVETTLKYTVHGPVLMEDPSKRRAYAMRAVWLETGAAPYLASLRMGQAQSWEEFRVACGFSGLPGENMVWADRSGDIGWQSVGFTPIRIGWDGRLPIWGNGDFEWQGFVPITAMPHLSNPESGYYGTANHNNVPKSYPNIFSDFYSDPARAQRLEEVLAEARGHTVADSMALQYDNKSMTAEAITPVITNLRHRGQARKAIEYLDGWDYHLNQDSVAGAIYDRWEELMLSHLDERLVPGGEATIGRRKLKAWMLSPEQFVFGANPERNRDKLIVGKLEEAVESLSQQYGNEMSTWTYGKTHYVQIDHPLQHLVSGDKANLQIGPLPRGGAGNTLNANHGDKQAAGASFRMIVDTSDWDSAVGTNAPGQSGDPRSRHYRDLFGGWNEGEYFPMYFSRPKVESAVDYRLELIPAQ